MASGLSAKTAHSVPTARSAGSGSVSQNPEIVAGERMPMVTVGLLAVAGSCSGCDIASRTVGLDGNRFKMVRPDTRPVLANGMIHFPAFRDGTDVKQVCGTVGSNASAGLPHEAAVSVGRFPPRPLPAVVGPIDFGLEPVFSGHIADHSVIVTHGAQRGHHYE